MREEKGRLRDCSLRSKAQMIMAIKGLENEAIQRWERGVDFVASQDESGDKILVRVVTQPESKSGTVGVNVANQMIETVKKGDYDDGILIGKRFSTAATNALEEDGIQMIPEMYTPQLKPQTLYSRVIDLVDDLCKAKCGQIPKKKTDCKGYSNDHYTCKIRLLSDNASFHFERGWGALLLKDLEQFISLRNSMSEGD